MQEINETIGKIEVGKTYVTRSGSKVRILGIDTVSYRYPFLGDNNKTYTPKGTVYILDVSSEDLVQVYVEPKVKQQSNNRHLHADLIIAWANGAKIEYKNRDGDWVKTPNPDWYTDIEYRIKPEAVVRYFSLEQDWSAIEAQPDSNVKGVFVNGKLQSIELI